MKKAAAKKENNYSLALRALGVNQERIKIARAFVDTVKVLRERPVRKVDANEETRLKDFVRFAAQHAAQSRSQILQDLWVLFEYGSKTSGYFVEFGATDGRSNSNSFLLEKSYQWKGILSEPNPLHHDKLYSLRDCHISTQCVYSRSGLTERLACTEQSSFSHMVSVEPDDHHQEKGRRAVADYVDVETISLNDLLDHFEAPQEIDYMSVDTEGSEYDILQAFDFSKRRIGLINVEHNYSPKRETIADLLQRNGYTRRFPELSRFDDWFIHRDLAG